MKNINILPKKRKKVKKVSVVLEDGEAVNLFKFLIKQNSFFWGKLTIANIKGKKKDNPSHISGRYLEIFANNVDKIPELENVIFVLDGDMDWVKNTKNKKVLALPGFEPIEVQIYKMLQSLPEKDDFWKNCSGINYKKKVVIGNNVNLDVTDINAVKKWYRAQKPHWGTGLSVVFERYFQLHKAECEKFLNSLRKIVKQCLQS